MSNNNEVIAILERLKNIEKKGWFKLQVIIQSIELIWDLLN